MWHSGLFKMTQTPHLYSFYLAAISGKHLERCYKSNHSSRPHPWRDKWRSYVLSICDYLVEMRSPLGMNKCGIYCMFHQYLTSPHTSPLAPGSNCKPNWICLVSLTSWISQTDDTQAPNNPICTHYRVLLWTEDTGLSGISFSCSHMKMVQRGLKNNTGLSFRGYQRLRQIWRHVGYRLLNKQISSDETWFEEFIIHHLYRCWLKTFKKSPPSFVHKLNCIRVVLHRFKLLWKMIAIF